MKKIGSVFGMLVVLLISVTVAFAQGKPTPEAAKSFLDFYYKGQGQGVVLADVGICTNVEEFECTDSVPLTGLTKDAKYNLWMMFVVPEGDKVDNIMIQFNQGGLTRFTRDVSVSGSVRYRTWKSFSLNRAGEWEVKILIDRGDTVETIKALSLTVAE